MSAFQKLAFSHDSLVAENESLKQTNKELLEALEGMIGYKATDPGAALQAVRNAKAAIKKAKDAR